MLNSMTGFGSAQGQADGVELAVEARSVNNRYLKVTVKLPDVFTAAEPEIEQWVRARVSRGTVQLSVQMKLSGEQAACDVNVDALVAYVDQLKRLDVEANPTLRIDLGAMLQLPGVCQSPSLNRIREQTQQTLMELIGRALDELVEMRKQEGQALRDDLLKNCQAIADSLAVVARRAGEAVTAYQQRLIERVRDLTGQSGIDVDADALAREVAIFAERCDVAEELSRLEAHLDQFRQTVEADEPVGRKLDFIAQEMLREANTIASKGNDAEIARHVVDIKTAIDRIKEQVQNVE